MGVRSHHRSLAWTALGVNLGGMPGLGSMLVGCWVQGLFQMALALGGFVLLMRWFRDLLRSALESLQRDVPLAVPPLAAGFLGGVLFFGAWLWSGVTCWRILRATREARPPIIGGPPGR